MIGTGSPAPSVSGAAHLNGEVRRPEVVLSAAVAPRSRSDGPICVF